MKKVILFVLLSIFWTVLLFPKNTLWDVFVRYAKDRDFTVVAQKKIDDRYKFTVKQTKVYYQNSEVATFKEAEMKPWIFYNEIEMKDIELSKSIPLFKDLKIQNLKAVFTLLEPKKINITGSSKLGAFMGEIDVFKSVGYILLKSNSIKDSFLKSYFKKTKEGMRYEFAY